MPMPDVTEAPKAERLDAPAYLLFPDDQGVEPPFLRRDDGLEVPNPRAGQPAPLRELAFQVPVPTIIEQDGEQVLVNTTRRIPVVAAPELGRDANQLFDGKGQFVRARIVPGTRIVETDVAPVVNALQANGWVLTDPPKEAQPHRPRNPDAGDAGKED